MTQKANLAKNAVLAVNIAQTNKSAQSVDQDLNLTKMTLINADLKKLTL